MMRQYVYEQLPLTQLRKNFDAIMSAGYSVSLFTDWTSDHINEVWVKSKVSGNAAAPASQDFFGAKPATKNMHPIATFQLKIARNKWVCPGRGMKDCLILKWVLLPAAEKNYSQNILFLCTMQWMQFLLFKD